MVSGERLDQTDLSQCAMADLQRVRQSGSVADAALSAWCHRHGMSSATQMR